MIRKILLFLLLLFCFLSGRPLFYLEEFYSLYYLPHHYQNNDIKRNLVWLEVALKSPFAPPLQALFIPKSEEQYEYYQIILTMHLNYLMAKNYIYLANRFQKHEPVFFNRPYTEENTNSIQISRRLYENALYYWDKTLLYYNKAKDYQRSESFANYITSLSFIENIIYRIDQDELNYKRVIDRQLNKLSQTESFFKMNKK